MGVVSRPPASPAAWVSQLAEDCAFYMEEHNHLSMQQAVLKAAESHGLSPYAVAKMIAEEWDRLGIVRTPMWFPGGPR